MDHFVMVEYEWMEKWICMELTKDSIECVFKCIEWYWMEITLVEWNNTNVGLNVHGIFLLILNECIMIDTNWVWMV